MKAHFSILGLGITASAPDEILQPIASAYRRFRTGVAVDGAISLDYRGEGSGRILVGEREFPIADGLDSTLQFYQQFLIALFDRVESHAVLHAAALTNRQGEVFLLAGPSGHGKSSLCLELVQRGHGFLGDDYAPLDLERTRVHPYPRSVALKPGSQAPIPDVFSQAALRSPTDRLFEKSLLDVGEVLGEARVVQQPAPLRYVFLLQGESAGDRNEQQDTIHVTVHSARADQFESELNAIAGVKILRRAEQGGTRALLLHPGEDALAGKALSRLLSTDDAVVLSHRGATAPPDFSRAPRFESMSRTRAALALCREMLNRRDGGRLLARFDDNPTELFVALASALREVECWELRVGSFEETVHRIQELVERDRSTA